MDVAVKSDFAKIQETLQDGKIRYVGLQDFCCRKIATWTVEQFCELIIRGGYFEMGLNIYQSPQKQQVYHDFPTQK